MLNIVWNPSLWCKYGTPPFEIVIGAAGFEPGGVILPIGHSLPLHKTQ